MFRDALRMVEETLRAYEEVRSREFLELRRVEVISSALINELLTKMKSLIATLSAIENTLENPESRVIKLCEGLTYVNYSQATSVIHRTPLVVVSHDSREGRTSVSSKKLSISLKDKTLEIRFRSSVISLNLLNKEDLVKHANLIKALASEKLELINYATTITESCRKKLGLRY